MLVHLVDLGLEMLVHDVSLHLEGGRQQVVLNSEGLVSDEDVFGLLEAGQLVLLGKTRELSVDLLLVGGGAQRGLDFHTILFCESGGLRGFGDDDRDTAASEGVTID